MTRIFDGTTPIYLQIAEELRTQILDGTLSEGQRLTSTTEYATRYRINPATANKAVSLLVDEGLVVKQRGIGMFVADGALERLQAARRGEYAAQVLGPALDAGLVLGLSHEALLAAVRAHLAAPPAARPEPAPATSPPLGPTNSPNSSPNNKEQS